MKKATCLIVLLVLCAAFTGCSFPGEKAPAMYIEPAQLTQAEEDIATLLGADTGCPIFDFWIDDTVQTMSIHAYELVDGQWDLFYGGGGRQFSYPQGRLALEFDTIGDGLREAVQSENDSGSSSFVSSEPMGLPSGFHRSTSALRERQEIVYEQEIPLAIQILTGKNEVRTFDLSYFHQPEALAAYDYEYVYAITVVFSQKPLS